MSNNEGVWKNLGMFGLSLAGGAGLIFFSWILFVGGQKLWSKIPFGIAGSILGVLIFLVTFFSARWSFPKRKFELSWQFISRLGFFEVSSYLLGLIIIISAVIWFFLPPEIIRILPSFWLFLLFSALGVTLLYGAGSCLTKAVKIFKSNVTESVVYVGCALIGVFLVSLPLWIYTENLPGSYYALGKVIFLFILILEIIYLIIFHLRNIDH